MNEYQAEQTIQKYLKPIFRFALKRCKTRQDAEDLSQEIVLKAFYALTVRRDINNVEKYVWSIAHNSLANYYKNVMRYQGVSIEDVEHLLSNNESVEDDFIKKESVIRLKREIARLSKLQRQIVVFYYYDNLTQPEIAKKLDISLSLVKWHLFDAKQNIKRRFNTMNDVMRLQFDPITFALMGFNGSAGTMGGTQAFFRSALSQNIAYCVYRTGKTINEIADELGVSPVYVESEVDFLEEYGYLKKRGSKYIANILIEDQNSKNAPQILQLHEKAYKKAASFIANALYDRLIDSGLLESNRIDCLYHSDKNYLLWAIIPYVAATCDDENAEKIRFEEVATARPDGAFDIANATIASKTGNQRPYYDSISKWCGPSWTGYQDRMLWCCKTEWSTKRTLQEFWDYLSPENIKLICKIQHGTPLTVDEYTRLAAQGLIKMDKNQAKMCAVWLSDASIKNELLQIGKEIKKQFSKQLQEIKSPFIKAVLDETPKHLQKMQAFGLQYIFRSDGWFLLYCIKELLHNGKLRLPTPEQQPSLMTIIVPTKP